MNTRTLLVGLIMFALVSTAGCESLATRKRANALTDTLRAYETAIRWGMFSHAYRLRLPEKGAKPKPPPASLDNVRVTAYEVLSPPTLVDPDTAVQTVGIEYVLKDAQTLHKLIDEQVWRYDKEHKVWRLASPAPTFGQGNPR